MNNRTSTGNPDAPNVPATPPTGPADIRLGIRDGREGERAAGGGRRAGRKTRPPYSPQCLAAVRALMRRHVASGQECHRGQTRREVLFVLYCGTIWLAPSLGTAIMCKCHAAGECQRQMAL